MIDGELLLIIRPTFEKDTELIYQLFNTQSLSNLLDIEKLIQFKMLENIFKIKYEYLEI